MGKENVQEMTDQVVQKYASLCRRKCASSHGREACAHDSAECKQMVSPSVEL